jgi:hypothetical protein
MSVTEQNSPSYRYGWKIHLTLPHDLADPLTNAAVDFFDGQGLHYKVGEGGVFEDGKGVTIYVGSRDRLEAVAAEIHRRGLAPLPAHGEVLNTDHRVIGNVWARFDDFDLKGSEGSQIRPFHRYGTRGISYQTCPIVFYDPIERRILVSQEFIDGVGKISDFVKGQPSPTSPSRMLEMSHRAHVALFGDYYTGSTPATRTWQEHAGLGEQDVFRRLIPLGYLDSIGTVSIDLSHETAHTLKNLTRSDSMKWLNSALPVLKEYLAGSGIRLKIEKTWADTLRYSDTKLVPGDTVHAAALQGNLTSNGLETTETGTPARRAAGVAAGEVDAGNSRPAPNNAPETGTPPYATTTTSATAAAAVVHTGGSHPTPHSTPDTPAHPPTAPSPLLPARQRVPRLVWLLLGW